MAKFVFTELIPGVARRCVDLKTNNMDYATYVADTLHSLVNFYYVAVSARAQELDTQDATSSAPSICTQLSLHLVDLSDTMRYVFDQDKKFHSTMFQTSAFDIAESVTSGADQVEGLETLSESERSWRKALLIDNIIDIKKHDIEF